MRPPVLVLPVLLLAACMRSPSPDPPPPADPPNVRTAELNGGFVTVRLRLPPDATGPVPAMITLMGAEASFEALGVAAVTYQIHWEKLRGLAKPAAAAPPGPPAERPRTWGKWLLASQSPHTVGQGWLAIIVANAESTIPTVLDWLARQPEIDAARIGVAGFSTNGFIALDAAAHDRRLAAAVAVAACGDWPRFMAESSVALNGEEPFEPEPQYATFIRTHDPIRRPAAMVHAAVLMVNGADDVTVPAGCAETTAKAFAKAYRRAGVPERFRFVLLPGTGHDVGPDAHWEMLGWVQRWLVQDGGPLAGTPSIRHTTTSGPGAVASQSPRSGT